MEKETIIPGLSDIRKFESLISNELGVEYVVSTFNATIGLLAVLDALDLSRSEIITTPLSWAGMLKGALSLNCTITFADVKAIDLTIDPDSVRKKITSNTKVILTADFLGYPCDLIELKKIALENDLILIHDVASGWGSLYNGKFSGYYADISIFSFGRNKALNFYGGGCTSTSNENYYNLLCQNIAHPDLQNLIIDESPNMFSFNANISLFTAQYANNVFESKNNLLLKRRKLISEFVGDKFFIPEISEPNYSYILLPKDYNYLPLDLIPFVEPIPFDKLIYDEKRLGFCGDCRIAEEAIKNRNVIRCTPSFLSTIKAKKYELH